MIANKPKLEFIVRRFSTHEVEKTCEFTCDRCHQAYSYRAITWKDDTQNQSDQQWCALSTNTTTGKESVYCMPCYESMPELHSEH